MPNFENPPQFNSEEQAIISEKQKEDDHQGKEQETLKLKKAYNEARDLFFHDPRDDYADEGYWDDLSEDDKEELNREAENRDQRLLNLVKQHGKEFADMTIAKIEDIASDDKIHPINLESEEGLLRFLEWNGDISVNKDLLNNLRKKIYMNGVIAKTQKLQEVFQSRDYSGNEVRRLRNDIRDFIKKGELDLPKELKLKLMRLDIIGPDKKSD